MDAESVFERVVVVDVEGVVDGAVEGTIKDIREGTAEGVVEGIIEGVVIVDSLIRGGAVVRREFTPRTFVQLYLADDRPRSACRQETADQH